MTLETLKSRPRKTLESMARRRGINRWHSLTKAELARALWRVTQAKSPPPRARRVKAKPVSPPTARRNGKAKARARRNLNGHAEVANPRDLCTTVIADRGPEGQKNFLNVTVCDGQWLRANWDLTRDSIRRAESRLAAEWHQAAPVIRVFAVSTDDVNSVSETQIKDVPIVAGVDTWYVPVPTHYHTYRLHIGYRAPKGTFFALAKSNLCHLPAMNAQVESLPEGKGAGRAQNGSQRNGHDRNGAADGTDARLGRPLGFSSLSHFGPAATEQRQHGAFFFQLDTELIIHGTTCPGSTLTLQGEPVELRDDGSFTVRVNQPEGRQVITFTAVSPRGGERRMVVLGMERNTKELERQYFDGGHSEGYTD